ncbi:MAG TPA: EAL domain-containing protein, partial [Actinomycetota bacterium]|nr:EAL domain-containing protein [Actinomycetota bacterium]
IGRTDRGSEIYPDIDISPLAGGTLISRRHAEIAHREEDFYLRDLGSRLGTLVNGESVAGAEHRLEEGDAITIGGLTLTFSEGCLWPDDLLAEWKREDAMITASTSLPTELPLIAQLPTALQEGQVQLHFQPQVVLETGEIPSVEALIRWEHPELGSVSPDRYISLAEDTGFIRVLTTFALKEAARAIAQWREKGIPVTVGVNLSVKDLEDPAFSDRVIESIEPRGAVPKDFSLEVTEGAVMHNPGIAIATLDHMASLGFNVSIDDFGTGQSSLTYLKDLPAHEVKLDKSFSIGMNDREKQIVTSAVELAHGLGMTVIAEGIEDEASVHFLREIGCEKGQGYYFGKPVPKEALDLEPRTVTPGA